LKCIDPHNVFIVAHLFVKKWRWGKLKRLLFIALLVVFACEVKQEYPNPTITYTPLVYGCTDPTACNFNTCIPIAAMM